jgi:hypothetical protein
MFVALIHLGDEANYGSEYLYLPKLSDKDLAWVRELNDVGKGYLSVRVLRMAGKLMLNEMELREMAVGDPDYDKSRDNEWIGCLKEVNWPLPAHLGAFFLPGPSEVEQRELYIELMKPHYRV